MLRQSIRRASILRQSGVRPTATATATASAPLGRVSMDRDTHMLLQTLSARQLLFDATSARLWPAPETAAPANPVACYVGFDPTADSLHLGNLLALIVLKHCQRAGLQPIALIGGATAKIGDPSGRDTERPMMTDDVLSRNQLGISKCLGHILRPDNLDEGIRTLSPIVVNNLDWFKGISCIDFVRDIGKSFRVGNMLAKDAVKNRLNSDSGISFTEFSYQLFQAYDFYHLFKTHNCMLQFGGSDQWGNIVAGCHYVQQVTGKEVYGLTIPLLTTSDGKKFGKSAGNAIWLDSEKTSPYHLYQYFLQTDDADVERFLKMFTFLPLSEVSDIMKEHEANKETRKAQKALASQVTSMIHGNEGLDIAFKATKYLFEGTDQGDLRLEDLHSIFKTMVQKTLDEKEVIGQSLVNVLVDSKLVESKSQMKRLISAGGVYLQNKKVDDTNYKIQAADIIGTPPSTRLLVVRIGKRTHHIVALQAPHN